MYKVYQGKMGEPSLSESRHITHVLHKKNPPLTRQGPLSGQSYFRKGKMGDPTPSKSKHVSNPFFVQKKNLLLTRQGPLSGQCYVRMDKCTLCLCLHITSFMLGFYLRFKSIIKKNKYEIILSISTRSLLLLTFKVIFVIVVHIT